MQTQKKKEKHNNRKEEEIINLPFVLQMNPKNGDFLPGKQKEFERKKN